MPMASIPKIACLPNGPYYLLNDMEAAPVPNLRRASGEPCATVRGVALCRCGRSKNKPFCDGTHGTIGFRDRNTADAGKNKRESYVGKRITILDNRALCAHAGYCSDNLKSVFRDDSEPWIDPDGAEMREIIATIEKCPSGALSYAIDGVEARAAQRAPMVTVTENGPYAVTGGIELIGVEFGEGASTEHYTLCRCGASKNKPFCDGSHWEVGFRDPG
jgi:CDGSH-type Zn-finger protein